MLDEGANNSKVQNLHGEHGRRCGRHKCKGVCALPGETSQCKLGGVSRGHRRLVDQQPKGRTGGEGVETSTVEAKGDIAKTAEMLETCFLRNGRNPGGRK